MKTTALLLAALVIFTTALVSCGVSQDDYDTLLEEKTQLQSDYNSMTAEKDVLTTELADARSELSTAQSELQQLENDLSEAQGEVDELQAEIDTLTADNADLESRVEAANTELKAVDLGNFIDEEELVNWRESVGIVETGTTYLDAIMELQRLALRDGYILSIDLDDNGENWVLSLNAFTSDRIYAVYPETTDIVYYADLTN